VTRCKPLLSRRFLEDAPPRDSSALVRPTAPTVRRTAARARRSPRDRLRVSSSGTRSVATPNNVRLEMTGSTKPSDINSLSDESRRRATLFGGMNRRGRRAFGDAPASAVKRSTCGSGGRATGRGAGLAQKVYIIFLMRNTNLGIGGACDGSQVASPVSQASIRTTWTPGMPSGNLARGWTASGSRKRSVATARGLRRLRLCA
jgi:hypothetical protein